MRAAFKEWAIVVDALGRGEQILILRKGGISEGRGGFKLEQSRFLLFPTLFHQQHDSVIPPARERYDQLAAGFSLDRVRIEFFAEVAQSRRLENPGHARALRGQHIWRDEVIDERFDWGRDKAIFAIAVRVFRLRDAVELPMIAAYGGCKSWIELDREIETNGAEPVLSDALFAEKLAAFCTALENGDGANAGADAQSSPLGAVFGTGPGA